MSTSEAARKAGALLNRYWDGRLPVDPGAIAQKAGIHVVGDESLANSGLSGSFEPANSAPVIRYNPREARVRQRFTVAHELGHFALGHGAAFRDPASNFSTGAPPVEAAANRFAAALLMPAEIVEYVIKKQAKPTLKSLATAFGVSTAAMRYRLIHLGWLRG